jgi:RNA-directed DNA polymerase
VISPILANIFLHEVLDTWFEQVVKPRLLGKAQLVRYADDAVLLFAVEADARKVLEVLPKRFGKYGLALHPEKTRLVNFRRPKWRKPYGNRREDMPGTFDLLGFTHYWGVSRNGNWVINRRTAKDRFRRSLKRIADWCREHRHDDVRAQRQALVEKLRGHYGYFGITGNFAALSRFLYGVTRVWRKWLDRRSHKAHMTWERMARLLERYPLPMPRISRPFLPARSEPVI